MKETLTDWLNARNNFGIFYPPMKAEEFVEFIKDYLLNENWYTVNPVNNEQVYTEILIDVLDRYSKKYKKEKRAVTDTNVEDIEEALEKLSTGKKIKMYELLRTFKREGIENFVTTRKKYVDVILSDYKRVLKENEQLRTEVNSLKGKLDEIDKTNFPIIN